MDMALQRGLERWTLTTACWKAFMTYYMGLECTAYMLPVREYHPLVYIFKGPLSQHCEVRKQWRSAGEGRVRRPLAKTQAS